MRAKDARAPLRAPRVPSAWPRSRTFPAARPFHRPPARRSRDLGHAAVRRGQRRRLPRLGPAEAYDRAEPFMEVEPFMETVSSTLALLVPAAAILPPGVPVLVPVAACLGLTGGFA